MAARRPDRNGAGWFPGFREVRPALSLSGRSDGLQVLLPSGLQLSTADLPRFRTPVCPRPARSGPAPRPCGTGARSAAWPSAAVGAPPEVSSRSTPCAANPATAPRGRGTGRGIPPGWSLAQPPDSRRRGPGGGAAAPGVTRPPRSDGPSRGLAAARSGAVRRRPDRGGAGRS